MTEIAALNSCIENRQISINTMGILAQVSSSLKNSSYNAISTIIRETFNPDRDLRVFGENYSSDIICDFLLAFLNGHTQFEYYFDQMIDLKGRTKMSVTSYVMLSWIIQLVPE